MLEDETDLSLTDMTVSGVLAMEQDLASVGCFQTGNNAQQGGLATAGWSQQGDQFAAGNFKVDVLQRLERAK